MVVAAVIALLSTLFAATAAYAGTGSITGKVTKPSGSAAYGSVVDLYSIDSDDNIWFEKSVKTRSDGTYTFGSLDRGRYIVGFGAESPTYAAEFWNNQTLIENAAAISVGSSRVSSINARLAVGGKVNGRVLTDGSSPRGVPDAEVIAYRFDDEEWTYGKSVLTTSDGRFNLGGLANGQWTLEFNPPPDGPDADLALEYWEDSSTFDDTETFLVKPGMTVGGKDAQLSQGGRISGRVTGPNGEPVVDALVFGYPSWSRPEVGNVAFTDENGEYVMKGMAQGQHRLEFVDALEFDPFGDGPDYISEWWDDKGSFGTADPLTVLAGTTSTGKDVQLDDPDNPLVNTSPPTIDGQPQVGEALTANPGAWNLPVDEEDYAYRWFVDGNSNGVHSGKTFTPSESQLGKTVTVEVSVIRGGRSVTAMSDPTAPVREGVLRNLTKPWIQGTPQVGLHLNLKEGDWNMDVAARIELLADGEHVFTGDYFVPTPDLIGKKLSIRVTATRNGYEPVTVSSDEVGPVTEGIFSPKEPVIEDVPIVGVPLHVQLHERPFGPTYSYQWLADGVAIAGADWTIFTPTEAELGKTLTFRITTSRPGFKTLEEVSAPSAAVVQPGTLQVNSTHPPEITGLPTVGKTLRASDGEWEPAGFETHQWLADGEPIVGAVGSQFIPTPDLLGKRISVRVTATRSGYISGAATSAETAPISTGTPFGSPYDLRATAHSVTSIDLAWTEVDDAAKYRISYRTEHDTTAPTTIDVGRVTTTTLSGLRYGSHYVIQIAAIRADGTVSSYSAPISVTTGYFVAPTDFRVTQQTPTSVTLSWTKVPGISKYRISHRIGTGTRTTVDVGDVSTKTITGLKPGTTYSVSIASLLSDGSRSSYSPLIDARTDLFLPPTNFASPGATSSTIDLTWTKAPDATKYRIAYGIGSDGTRVYADVGNVSSRTLTGLRSGTTYTMSIRAYLPDGTRSPYTPRITVPTD